MKTIIDDQKEIDDEFKAIEKKSNRTIIIVLIIAIVGLCILFYFKNRNNGNAE